MTIVIGGTTPANLDHIGIGAFTAGTTTVATGSVYRVSHGLDFVELTGSFTYDSAGVLTGGTITGWKQVDESRVEFTASDFSIAVADFLGWVTGSDNAALVNAMLGGDDSITGSAFNDQLNCGAGNDTMAGGKGNDTYTVSEIGDQVIENAGQGIDWIKTSVSDYVLAANVENLHLLEGVTKGTGNDLNNYLIGDGNTNNRLEGGLGNDTLEGGEGNDTLVGGKGDDVFIIADLTDFVNENANGGTDTIRITDGLFGFSLNSAPFAQVENLSLESKTNSIGEGNALANVISGHKAFSVTYSLNGLGGNDTLSSGQGNDTLTGGTGADVMTGFGGNDIYEVDDAKDLIVEAAGASGGIDQVNTQIDLVLGANVEVLNLLGGALNGTGNALGNSIFGNGAYNSLLGLSGNDSLSGGDNDDTLNGGTGNDTLNGGAGIDSLIGGTGNDLYLNVEAGDVILELAGQGIDTIQIASGGFSLDTPALANIENLNLMGGTSTGTGNSLNNFIKSFAGGTSSDTLEGGLGNDTLDGGSGIDTLRGGAGNDTYIVGSAGDVAEESLGAGIDTVIVASGASSYTLNNNVENLVLAVGGSGTGNSLNNVITGNDNANTLNGGIGNDTLIGGKGGDTYHVDSAGDRIVEGTAASLLEFDHVEATVDCVLGVNLENLTLSGAALKGTGNTGNNLIHGNNLNNRLIGLSGNDSLFGLGGDDTLEGGAGNDRLDGDIGNDSMAGGAGNDAYTVNSLNDVVLEAARQGIDEIHTTLKSFSLDSKALANVENLIVYISDSTGTGNSLNNLVFSFSNGNDTLIGLGGNDTLDGGLGADSLEGGTGNDTYYVDDVNDTIKELAGEGIDTIVTSTNLSLATGAFVNFENVVVAGPFAADIDGNALNNSIKGHDSSDNLFGAVGNDTLTGNAGDDVLDGGIGIDLMIGGIGDDKYTVDNTKDRIIELASAGTNVDTVISNVESYALSANIERLELGTGALNGTGNAQSNSIFGNGSNNKLSGMAGNDAIDGGAGADTMIGGAGNDSYNITEIGDAIVEAAGQGIDGILTNLTNFTLNINSLANVENLTFAGGFGAGNSLSNYITAISGNNGDTLYGEAGNDTLDAGGGDDSLVGGTGNDTYLIESALDAVVELANEGRDTVRAAVDFSLSAKGFENVENLVLTGSATSGDGNGLANVIAAGTIGATLNGLDGNDTLLGGGGNDILNGGSGADSMAGGKGSDDYFIDSAKDRILELAGADSGFDTVYAGVNYALGANLEQLILEGSAVSGTGNSLDNNVFGNDNANKLLGLNGDDVIYGNLGNDTLDGGIGSDILDGGAGNDSILGGAGNDTLFDGEGADTMAGGAGNDRYSVTETQDKISEAAGQGIDIVFVAGDIGYTLAANLENGDARFGADIVGNDLGNLIKSNDSDSDDNHLSGAGGNDTLVAGYGADTLTGGAGRDRFAIDFIDTIETITDFDAGPVGDALDLSDLLTGYVAGTSNANEFVMFEASAGNTTVKVDIDGAANGANFVDVCVLQGVNLTNVNQAIMEGNLLLG